MANYGLEIEMLSDSALTVSSVEKHVDTRLYQPLSGKWRIRVLSLTSDAIEENGTLQCTFTERNLDSFVPWAGYCAISYVWGASLERIEIICNGY
jgi:hypothetical protein